MEEVMPTGNNYTLAGVRAHKVGRVCRYVTHKGLTLLFALSSPINNPQILRIL